MTRESMQLSRRTTSRQSAISVGTSSGFLLSPSPNRVALIFSAPLTNRFTVSLAFPTAVLDQGITLYPAGNPVTLTVEEHGDIVTRAWAAISATASQTATVIEVFLSE